MTRTIVLCLASLLCAGCTSSLVYSPSLHLPAEPLVKERGVLAVAAEMLPETRPEARDKAATVGGSATLRYAFSDALTLGLKGWRDFEEGRGGASAEAIIGLSERGDGYRLALIPRAGLVISNDGSLDGWGLTIPVALWTPAIGLLHPYAALGPIVGWRDLGTSPAQWGYGAVGNLGMAIDITRAFAATIEVTGVVQVNQYDHITHGIAAPSLSLSWRF